ncbi:hypothetical protein LXL04_006451 [Taraxacum kok-saghyz]
MRIKNGVPARCAGDSSIRRMVSFRKTERPIICFRTDGESCYSIYSFRLKSPAAVVFVLYN